MSTDHTQKQVGVHMDERSCQTVGQKAIPASAMIFHQARKQFAALKLEHQSSSTPAKKPVVDVKVGLKPVGLTPIQGLPGLQSKLPTLKMTPSLHAMISPKYQGTMVKHRTSSIVASRKKSVNSETVRKVTNGTAINTQTLKLARVKTASTTSPNQQKHSVFQHTSSSSNKSMIKPISTPITLRVKPGTSCVSSSTLSSRSPIQHKSEAKKTETQEAQKKQPSSIKVISVNALNTRQPKVVTTENISKPLRLAPSLSKANIMPKANQCSTNSKLSPHKPFTTVTNVLSHEKYGKPISVVASSTKNRSNQTKL